MSVDTDDGDYETLGVEAADLGRYDAVEFDIDAVVIIDEHNDDAWVQSDSAIGLAHMR